MTKLSVFSLLTLKDNGTEKNGYLKGQQINLLHLQFGLVLQKIEE